MKTSTKKIPFDPSVPDKLEVNCSRIKVAFVLFGCLFLLIISIYLVITSLNDTEHVWLLGLVGIASALYLSYDAFKKLSSKFPVLTISSDGISPANADLMNWNNISNEKIEKTGIKSLTWYLNFIFTEWDEETEKSIDITYTDISNSKLRWYLKYYRQRFEEKHPVKDSFPTSQSIL